MLHKLTKIIIWCCKHWQLWSWFWLEQRQSRLCWFLKTISAGCCWGGRPPLASQEDHNGEQRKLKIQNQILTVIATKTKTEAKANSWRWSRPGFWRQRRSWSSADHQRGARGDGQGKYWQHQHRHRHLFYHHALKSDAKFKQSSIGNPALHWHKHQQQR